MTRRDHPRSRGVYSRRKISPARTSGSSPLARGLHRGMTAFPFCTGIIPARAGVTVRGRTSSSSLTDHPRSRGVYGRQVACGLVDAGSSPLARGLPDQVSSPAPRKGIIPARAGFTPTGGDTCRSTPDHPRSRGVYLSSSTLSAIVIGSSPLARGLPLPFLIGDTHERIIPARAGFTGGAGHCEYHRQDHPRSRGVYMRLSSSTSTLSGSSPLARGLPRLSNRRTLNYRIIPARAGFTGPFLYVVLNLSDHPRSRGVYLVCLIVFDCVWGSSPLARGLRVACNGA